jgi:hypothetical protein
MKKGNSIALIIIVIFTGLLTISIMSMEDVPIIKVKAEVTVTDGNPAVKIVNVEQDAVNPLKAPRGDSNGGFPSVMAKAMINFGSGGVSYWAANDYHENGTYDFVIGFQRGVTTKQGNLVLVTVRVVDEKGDLYKSARDTKFIVWE